MAKISEKTWSRVIGTVTTAGLCVSICVLPMFDDPSLWAGDTIPNAKIQDGPPSGKFLINAYGGAKHGTTLKVVSDCPPENTDCTWSFHPNGMIVSDTNPKLAWNAYGGAKHGADIALVNNCTPNITDCTWSWRNGMIVSNTNLNLAVNAYGGNHHGAPLKLVNNCTPFLDGCAWNHYYSTPGWFGTGNPIAIYLNIGNDTFQVNAYGGAKHKTELKVVNNCPYANTDCTWRHHISGMVTSETNPVLAWNAYGGAYVGAKVTLVDNCPSNNTDCLWDWRPDGLIVSRTNPKLAVKALGGTQHGTPLILADDCTPTITGCRWDMRGFIN